MNRLARRPNAFLLAAFVFFLFCIGNFVVEQETLASHDDKCFQCDYVGKSCLTKQSSGGSTCKWKPSQPDPCDISGTCYIAGGGGGDGPPPHVE